MALTNNNLETLRILRQEKMKIEDQIREVKKIIAEQQFEYEGRTQSIWDWSRELHMPYATLYRRIITERWTMDQALLVPITKGRPGKRT